MTTLGQNVMVARAIAPTATLGSAAAATAIEVDANGYDKALFILYNGVQAAASAKNDWTALEVQEAGTSGGTYAAVAASLTTIGSTATNKIKTIDFTVSPTKPYLKLCGTTGSNGTSPITVAAVCVLYGGTRQNPTSQEIALVVA